MEVMLFVVLVAALAVVGVGLGLAVAPRLSRWDERRSGADFGRCHRRRRRA